MNLEEAQKAVDQWIKAHGGYFEPSVNLARLLEESGELASDLLRKSGYLKPAPGSEPNSDNEFGDVLFVLCALANQHGVSLADALSESLARYNRRDQHRH